MVLAQFEARDAGSVHQQIAEAEALREQLQEQIIATEDQTEECHMAGTAVISALQLAMAPLMAELAVVRGQAQEIPSVSDTGRTNEDMELEIARLRKRIGDYQQKVNQLQTTSQKRNAELRKTRADLSNAQETLEYETQRVRHQDISKQMGFDSHGEHWAGLGPTGVGKRTLEVRAEKRLREIAETRASKLQRDVMKTANESADLQATIAKLGKRLGRVRGLVIQRDQQLAELSQSSANLQSQLAQAGGASDVSAVDLDLGHGSTLASTGLGRKGAAASTGKLPQLSF